MKLPGKWVVLVLVVGSGAVMAAFFLVGEDLRQDYRVASKGDRERTDLELTDARVAWLEDAQPGGGVLAYDIATKQRVTLEARNATLRGGIALDGDLVAWMETPPGVGPRIRVHDLARNASAFASAARDELVLVPRSLEGNNLLAYGSIAGEARSGLWRLEVRVTSQDHAAVGTFPVPGSATPDAKLSRGRVWWSEGASLHAVDALTGAPVANISAGGDIASFDADGDLVAWAEVHGNLRRVLWADIGNGTRGEVSASPADQHGPAVNGTRVLFVQHDGLVRLKDLASGEERVLPARTQENLRLRLATEWAAWLSGTIEGHNVLMVPVPANG